VAHGEGCERAISLEDFAPMGFIGQLHAREFCLDLPARELLKCRLSRGA
jgi:hypothetical protein